MALIIFSKRSLPPMQDQAIKVTNTSTSGFPQALMVLFTHSLFYGTSPGVSISTVKKPQLFLAKPIVTAKNIQGISTKAHFSNVLNNVEKQVKYSIRALAKQPQDLVEHE
ncbi:hypothetical protein J1614_009124 [Plenodomus biglobosus]|nr:hypothetical protein J1614_009124 [Plenodomus biglobosus]